MADSRLREQANESLIHAQQVGKWITTTRCFASRESSHRFPEQPARVGLRA